MTVDLLRVWREEIERELADARAALRTAEDQLAAASLAAGVEKRACGQLIGAIGRFDQPAAALMHRVDLSQAGARRAIGAETLARGRVEATKVHIADLNLALAQLDTLAPMEIADAA